MNAGNIIHNIHCYIDILSIIYRLLSIILHRVLCYS